MKKFIHRSSSRINTRAELSAAAAAAPAPALDLTPPAAGTGPISSASDSLGASASTASSSHKKIKKTKSKTSVASSVASSNMYQSTSPRYQASASAASAALPATESDVAQESPKAVPTTRLTPLSYDACISYLSNKKYKLNSKSREAIEAILRLEILVDAQHNVQLTNTSKENLYLRNGLTEIQYKEIVRLKEIEAERNYKEKIRNKTANDEEMGATIAIESHLVPAMKTIEWWNLNFTALKSNAFWASANQAVESLYGSNKKPEKVQAKIHKLESIRADFNNYAEYSGFSGTDLIVHLEKYLLPLEKSIVNIQQYLLEKKKKGQNEQYVCEYLNTLIAEIEAEIKLVVTSMLYRLDCAGYYSDIKCDDLVTLTLDRVKHQINADKLVKGYRPERRRGNTSELILKFAKYVLEYKRSHPNDTLFNEKCATINCLKKPDSWPEIANQAAIIHHYNNPLILFFMNCHEDMLEKLGANKRGSVLLGSQNRYTPSLVEKFESALILAEQELAKLNFRPDDVMGTSIEETIREARKAFGICIQRGIIKLQANAQRDLEKIMEAVFTEENFDITRFKTEITTIMLATNFIKEHTNKMLSPDTDIIIFIASKIANKLDSDNSADRQLKKFQIKNIVDFLKVVTHKGQTKRDLRTYSLLAKASSLIKKSLKFDNAIIMHLALNIMEIPFETTEDLIIALERHRYVAELYHEEWTALKQGDDHDDSNLLTINYLQNVYMKIIQISPYINYTEFDTNDIVQMLEQIETKHDDKVNEIRFTIEKYTFDKLKSSSAINEYLTSTSSNSGIDVKKLRLLISRVDSFFVTKEFKDQLLSLLKDHVFKMLKQHCMNTIINGSEFSSSAFAQCDALYNGEISKQLKSDSDLTKQLETYNRSDNGATPRLSELLIMLWPNTERMLAATTAYANKRMQYLRHNPRPLAIDFRFFKLIGLENYRKEYNGWIASLVSNVAWTTGFAGMIEMLGTDEQVNAYRCNRLNEILTLLKSPTKIIEARRQFIDFTNGLWRGVLSHGFFINPASKLPSGMSVSATFDDLIATQLWSPLLEQVVAQFAVPAQVQMLHAKIQRSLSENSVQLSNKNVKPDVSAIIVYMINTLKQMDDVNVMTDKNVQEFLQLFDSDILTAVDEILDSQAPTLDFMTLTIFSNLLGSVLTDKLKISLLERNKSNQSYNPYWLSLVNRMDDRAELKFLEEEQLARFGAHVDVSIEFKEVLAFTKRLASAKEKLHLMATCRLFKSADIEMSLSNNAAMEDVLNDKLTTGKLMSLWCVCLTEFKTAQSLDMNHSREYKELLNMTTLLTTQVTNRFHNDDDPELFSLDFAKAAAILTSIKQDSTTSNLPFIKDCQRLFAMDLYIQLEKYLHDELGDVNKVLKFRRYCADLEFQAMTPEHKIEEIKKSFGFRHTKDANKVLSLIGIHKKLKAMNDNSDLTPIQTVVDQLIELTKTKGSLIMSAPHSKGLLNLAMLASTYFPGSESLAPQQTGKRLSSLLIPGSRRM